MKNRIKSLLWRTAMVALAFLVAELGTNLDMFNLSPQLTTFVGLILGEISKYLNTGK